jgi:hypothetical protein
MSYLACACGGAGSPDVTSGSMEGSSTRAEPSRILGESLLVHHLLYYHP